MATTPPATPVPDFPADRPDLSRDIWDMFCADVENNASYHARIRRMLADGCSPDFIRGMSMAGLGQSAHIRPVPGFQPAWIAFELARVELYIQTPVVGEN